MPNLIVKNPAQRFDLAYLYANGSKKEIEELANTAKNVIPGISARCAMVHVADLKNLINYLKDSIVRPEVVIDFPDGLGGLETKEFEAKQAALIGAVSGDLVVNLRYVAERNKEKIIAECKAVLKNLKEAKLICQAPYLWQFDREAIPWILEILPEAGIYCFKDWTTRQNFLIPAEKKLDIETETRIAYTEFIANYIVKHNLPLLIKIAGKVRKENARRFINAGADLLGVSYEKAREIYEALL